MNPVPISDQPSVSDYYTLTQTAVLVYKRPPPKNPPPNMSFVQEICTEIYNRNRQNERTVYKITPAQYNGILVGEKVLGRPLTLEELANVLKEVE